MTQHTSVTITGKRSLVTLNFKDTLHPQKFQYLRYSMLTSKITEQRWETEEYESDYVHHCNLESRHLWKRIEFCIRLLFVVLRQIGRWVSLSYKEWHDSNGWYGMALALVVTNKRRQSHSQRGSSFYFDRFWSYMRILNTTVRSAHVYRICLLARCISNKAL